MWRFSFAFLLLLSSPAATEEFIWPAGESGLAAPALSFELYEGDTPIDASGVLVVEQANGRDYLVQGLPDPALGADSVYSLTWEHAGARYAYVWPQKTRTPQAIVWRPRFTRMPGALTLAVGDTLPTLDLVLEGLSSDPTGGTVAFSLVRLKDGTRSVDAAAGSLHGAALVVDPKTGEQSWSATLRYSWSSGDTSQSGDFRGHFQVTFPGGGVMTAPPRKDLDVRIVP